MILYAKYGEHQPLNRQSESYARPICLSNNAAERALRGIALGRRSWLFADSDRGVERVAAMYSLMSARSSTALIRKLGSPTS